MNYEEYLASAGFVKGGPSFWKKECSGYTVFVIPKEKGFNVFGNIPVLNDEVSTDIRWVPSCDQIIPNVVRDLGVLCDSVMATMSAVKSVLENGIDFSEIGKTWNGDKQNNDAGNP